MHPVVAELSSCLCHVSSPQVPLFLFQATDVAN